MRVNAHHIICPGCQEKVFIDELVSGHCPLCGCVMEDEEMEDDYEEVMERSDIVWFVFHHHVYNKLCEMGVAPFRIMELLTRIEEICDCNPGLEEKLELSIEANMKWPEKIIPKRCRGCGSIFVRHGRKVITVDFNRNEFKKSYYCPRCRGNDQ